MPAGGDTYTIRARFVVDDQSGRGVGAASRGVTQLENRVTQAGSRMSSAFGAAIGILGSGLAFGAATRGIIRMNDQVDTANAGLATLFSAITGAPIERAMGAATDAVKGLRRDAAEGVGELQDYVTGFQSILAPVLGAGQGADVARELTRNALGAGFALQGQRGLQNATFDIQQALTAGAGQRTTPIVNAALRAVGKTNEQFNQLSVGDRIDTLNEAFGAFAPGVELMGKTWEAQMGTMRDNINNILLTVTRPIFDRWKDSLIAANAWLSDNKELIEEMATVGGEKLLALWDNLITNARTYATIVAGAGLAKGVTGVAGAVGVGGSAVGAAGVGVVAVAVVGAAFAVSGALAEWPGLMLIITESSDRFMESLLPLGDAFGRLTAEGSLLNVAGLAIIATFGWMMDRMTMTSKAIMLVIDAFGTFIRVVGVIAQSMVKQGVAFLTGDTEGGKAIGAQTTQTVTGLVSDFLGRQAAAGDLAKKGGPGGEDGLEGLPTTASVTNINGPITIQQKVEQNADPARVLTAWKDVLERTIRFKDGAAPERR